MDDITATGFATTMQLSEGWRTDYYVDTRCLIYCRWKRKRNMPDQRCPLSKLKMQNVQIGTSLRTKDRAWIRNMGTLTAEGYDTCRSIQQRENLKIQTKVIFSLGRLNLTTPFAHNFRLKQSENKTKTQPSTDSHLSSSSTTTVKAMKFSCSIATMFAVATPAFASLRASVSSTTTAKTQIVIQGTTLLF
jgi:hypothetical protein